MDTLNISLENLQNPLEKLSVHGILLIMKDRVYASQYILKK